jgi:Multicopper oxidase
MWYFHCHNEWHLAMGLAMVFGEGLDHLPRLPPDLPTNCGNFAPHDEFADLYNQAPQWFRSFSHQLDHE